MRTGYNKALTDKIFKKRLEESYKTNIDVHGNVQRDHQAEIKALAEDELNSILTETPIGYFDGHRKFSEHYQSNNILPVVRNRALAPLSPKIIKLSLKIKLFNFFNEKLGRFIYKKDETPILNQDKDIRKAWAIGSCLEQYSFQTKSTKHK